MLSSWVVGINLVSRIEGNAFGQLSRQSKA